jgi:tRNA G18 (ribose-2'-O)-methylase SpoU
MNIILLAHNIRSTYNVGSLLRSADGFGVDQIIFSGYSPYPTLSNDQRLPHIRDKLTQQIHKTALGAEKTIPCSYDKSPLATIADLHQSGYTVAALEQTPNSVLLPTYNPPAKLALLLGEEVHGIEPELLAQCDIALEIPMYGSKESFNVSVATGIALYALRTARSTT